MIACDLCGYDGPNPYHAHNGEEIATLLAAKRPDARDWLILCLTERGHGDVGLWWGPSRSGYVTALEDAGRYTEKEARAVELGSEGAARAVRLAGLKTRTVVHLNAIEGSWDGIRAWRKANA